MTQVADVPSKSRKKPRNNLSSFDASKIEAELFAIESETIGLDPSSRNKQSSASVVNNTEKVSPKSEQTFKESEDGYKAKARPTNVVEFSPESSELLHRLARSKPATAQKNKLAFKDSGPKSKNLAKLNSPNRGASGVQFKSGLSRGSSVDGLSIGNRRPVEAKVEATEPAIKSLNLTSVALGGLRKANEFNSYSLRNHKSSLHNQIESRSMFERNADSESNGVTIYDHSTKANSGVKRYTKVKRSQKMLGGVDQHNLGPGGIKKALMYRPVKLILPVVAVLLVSSYLMYSNLPGINLKFAESRAGIAISRPAYSPDGFKLSGSPETETGRVALNFKKGDSSYTIIQNVSDWDSTALLENKVLKETDDYSAYTDRGLTIYVYSNKAVWVNQGKVNEIDTTNAKLEVEDMVRIAGSM